MLAEMMNKLYDAGFIVKVNDSHTALTVSLNRSISTMEVKFVLKFDESVIYTREGNTVVVSEK